MRGGFEEARDLVRQNLAILLELGDRNAAAAHSISIAEVEIMAGNLAVAEEILRRGYDDVSALGDLKAKANAAWRLADVLCRLERDDEAESFVRVAADWAPGGWVEIWWRAIQAGIEARRGCRDEAGRLFDEALDRMWQWGESGMHADALLELATTARTLGDPETAIELVARSAAIAEHLGYTVALERARAAQRELTA
jgi:tetratricopeptide (TPR) repeat protein